MSNTHENGFSNSMSTYEVSLELARTSRQIPQSVCRSNRGQGSKKEDCGKIQREGLCEGVATAFPAKPLE